MKNKILILGKGYIAGRLLESIEAVSSDGRITSLKDAQDEIDKFSPEIIINCIGYIGKNVDDCEIDKDKAIFSNTFVPLLLAEACLRNKVKLIHISSGCIYHYDYIKNKPVSEEEVPDFLDLYYSRTKIYAERALEVLTPKYGTLIIRIRVPMDNRPHPKNTLTKLINYKKVIDLPNSITYIPDYIQALKHLIAIDAKGIYNVVNRGGLKYPEILDVYKKYIPDFKYEVVDYKKLNLVRTNLVLSTKKLEESGFKVRDIHEVMEECVREYIKSA